MKCQILFSRKNKKNIVSLSSTFGHRGVNEHHMPRSVYVV